MTTLKKYNLAGDEIGVVPVDAQFVNAEANGQMIKDYIVALRANARQWSAHTKTRAEVNHSNKKPHPQKGGGRARQGALSTPQYKGGGRVFGPRAKFDQHVKINKKERRAAIRFLIAEKIRENKVHLIENTAIEAPKTRVMADFLKKGNIAKRTLFLAEGSYLNIDAGEGETFRFSMPDNKHDNLIKSIRNLPKAYYSLATNVSGYDILCAHDIIMSEAAFEELTAWLC